MYILESVVNPEHFYVGLAEDRTTDCVNTTRAKWRIRQNSSRGLSKLRLLFVIEIARPLLSASSNQAQAAHSHGNIYDPPSPFELLRGRPLLRDGVISNSSLFESEVDGANPSPAASFGKSSFDPPGGEIASRLAYTQKSEGQNLPERPLCR